MALPPSLINIFRHLLQRQPLFVPKPEIQPSSLDHGEPVWLVTGDVIFFYKGVSAAEGLHSLVCRLTVVKSRLSQCPALAE